MLGLGDQLKSHRKHSNSKDETLTVKFVNSWIFAWMRENPLICQYTGEGNFAGLLDYERIEYFFKSQDHLMAPRFVYAFQQIEQGMKQQLDKMRSDSQKEQRQKMQRKGRK